MTEKLDVLERELAALIAASGDAAAQTTLEGWRARWKHAPRVSVRRNWNGQLRWVYVNAIDEGVVEYEYLLFLGWYSDPPGEVFWEGRAMATDLRHTLRLVEAWVLLGIAPEAMPWGSGRGA